MAESALLTGASKPLPPGALPSGSLPYVDDSLVWRDKPWAIAFYIHLAVICLLAFGYGTFAISTDAISANGTGTNSSPQPYDLNADVVIRCVTVAIVAGVVTSYIMMSVLRWLGAALIRASFIFSIASTALIGAGLMGLGLVAPAAVLFFMSALTTAYYFCVRRRIPFAAAHLAVSSAALRGAPGVLALSFFLLLVQAVWSLLWAFAVLGVEFLLNNNGGKPGAGGSQDNSSGTGAGGTTATFFMLLSFFWGNGVVRNVSAFSSASVVGDFWYKGDSAKAPVWGAVRRAFTTSFGTISLGAFLVALCAALRYMKAAAEESAKKSGRDSAALTLVLCLVSCLLFLLTAVIEWANRWAIVYAALTGLAFKPAGLAAVQLFKERGWDEILNADLVHGALSVAGFVSAAVGAIAGGGLAWTLDKGPEKASHAAIAAFLCFFVGLSFAMVLTESISTATRAVFVAWALAPGALQATHPDHMQALASAWHEAHPEIFETCGYARACGIGAGGLAPVQPAVYNAPPAGYGSTTV